MRKRRIHENHKITNREKEVLEMIARELTAKEIATQLYISTNTVRSHRKNLLDKLDARNSAGLVRRAFEIGHLVPGRAM